MKKGTTSTPALVISKSDALAEEVAAEVTGPIASQWDGGENNTLAPAPVSRSNSKSKIKKSNSRTRIKREGSDASVGRSPSKDRIVTSEKRLKRLAKGLSAFRRKPRKKVGSGPRTPSALKEDVHLPVIEGAVHVDDDNLSEWMVDREPGTTDLEDLSTLVETIDRDEERHSEAQLQASVKKFAEEKGITTEVDLDKGENVPYYYMQGNLEHYTRESLRMRAALRANRQIQQAISMWWDLLPRSKDETLEKRSYREHYFRIYKALINDFKRDLAFQASEEEWDADTGGPLGTMNEEIFMNSMFEITDMWCDGVRAEDYVEFLLELFEAVTEDIRGQRRWKPLADIQILERIAVHTDQPFVYQAHQWDEVYPSLAESKREISELIKFLPGESSEWQALFDRSNVQTVGDLASANMPEEMRGLLAEDDTPQTAKVKKKREDSHINLNMILSANPSTKQLINPNLDRSDFDIQPISTSEMSASYNKPSDMEDQRRNYRLKRAVTFKEEDDVAPKHYISDDDEAGVGGPDALRLNRAKSTPDTHTKIMMRDHNMEVLRFALREFQTSSSMVLKKQEGVSRHEQITARHLEIEALRVLSLKDDDFLEHTEEWEAVFPSLSTIDLPIEDVIPFLDFEPVGEKNPMSAATKEEMSLWRRRNWRGIFESYGIATIGDLCAAKRKNYQFLKRGGITAIRMAVRKHARSGYVRHDPHIFAGPDWKRSISPWSGRGTPPTEYQSLSRDGSTRRSPGQSHRSSHSPTDVRDTEDEFSFWSGSGVHDQSIGEQAGFWTEVVAENPLYDKLQDSVAPVSELIPFITRVDDLQDHQQKWSDRFRELGIHTVGQVAAQDRNSLLRHWSTDEVVKQVEDSLDTFLESTTAASHDLVYPTLAYHDSGVRPIIDLLTEEYGDRSIDPGSGVVQTWSQVFDAAGISNASTVGQLASASASIFESEAALSSIRRALCHFERTLDPADFRALWPELSSCEDSIVSILPFLEDGGSVWLPEFQGRGISTIGLLARTLGGKVPITRARTRDVCRAILTHALGGYAKRRKEDHHPIFPDLAGCEIPIKVLIHRISVSEIDRKGWVEQFQLRDVGTVGDLAKLPMDNLNSIPRINARSCIIEALKALYHEQHAARTTVSGEQSILFPRLRDEHGSVNKLLPDLPQGVDWTPLFEKCEVYTIGELAKLPEAQCYVHGMTAAQIDQCKFALRQHERLHYPNVEEKVFPPLINNDHNLAKLCAHLPGDGWVDAFVRCGARTLGELCAMPLTTLTAGSGGRFFTLDRVKTLRAELSSYHKELEDQRARLIIYPFVSGDDTPVEALLKYLPKRGRWRTAFWMAGLKTVGEVGMQSRAAISDMKVPHAILFIHGALEKYKKEKDFIKNNTFYPKLHNSHDPISKLFQYMPGTGWDKAFKEQGLETMGDLARLQMANIPRFLQEGKLLELIRQALDKYMDRRPRNEQVYRPLIDCEKPISVILDTISSSQSDRKRWESNFKYNDMTTIGDVASVDISVVETFPKPGALIIIRRALKQYDEMHPLVVTNRRHSTYGSIKSGRRKGSVYSLNSSLKLTPPSRMGLSLAVGSHRPIPEQSFSDLESHLSESDSGTNGCHFLGLSLGTTPVMKGFKTRGFKKRKATPEQAKAARAFIPPRTPRSARAASPRNAAESSDSGTGQWRIPTPPSSKTRGASLRMAMGTKLVRSNVERRPKTSELPQRPMKGFDHPTTSSPGHSGQIRVEVSVHKDSLSRDRVSPGPPGPHRFEATMPRSRSATGRSFRTSMSLGDPLSTGLEHRAHPGHRARPKSHKGIIFRNGLIHETPENSLREVMEAHF